MSWVRGLAARVIGEAERRRIFVDEALEEVRQQALSARDRGFLTLLVYGVTRHRRTLDYLLRKISGVDRFDQRVHRHLLVGLYEIHFLGTPAHAAVDEAVELARAVSRRSGNFVNAVLRKAAATDREALLARSDLSIRYSYPPWLVERWRRAYPDRLEELLEAGNRILPVTGRVNRLRTTREALGLPAGRCPDSVLLEGPVGEIEAVRDGRVTVQDETAMGVAPLVEPEGRRVVDLCASPGGKATHLAELGGRVVAVDRTREKIEAVRTNARRAGVRIDCLVADGRDFAGRFDAVLLDAPCSNTGVLMRRPDARWRLRPEDIPRAAEVQRALLENAARLAPRIVYATCSIEPEENDGVVDAFLHGRPEWRRDYRGLTLPGLHAAGGFAVRLIK